MKPDSKIYVAGHTGLVGSAIVRALTSAGFQNLVLRTREELDLTDANAVHDFFRTEKLEYVFMAAAKVGGILANATYPAEFLCQNLAIELNVITAAHENNVTKLLFLGSSCIYPRDAAQPLKEEYLLTGPLEETNRAYAIAKIAGIELCRSYRAQYGSNFISAMPTNLYGPGDNFDPETSHVLPALIRKFHEAQAAGLPSVSLWGTGTPKREFLHVDDLARACLFLMEHYDGAEPINVGTGEDLSIQELAQMIQGIVGYDGTIEWDQTKPDGTPRKLLDVTKLHALGWKHATALPEGIQMTYDWYQAHYA